MMSSTSTGVREDATCSRMANERAVAPSFCARCPEGLAARVAVGFRSAPLRCAVAEGGVASLACPRLLRMGHPIGLRATARFQQFLKQRIAKCQERTDHQRAANRSGKNTVQSLLLEIMLRMNEVSLI